jgi:alpha-tubulin suppressor-like RCC1 family protein
VRRTDGGVWCWGGGAFGQLGDGGAANRSEAAPVGSPALIADELAAGLLHTCARRGDRVWCWGANTRGQLGDGTTIDRPRPVEVAW